MADVELGNLNDKAPSNGEEIIEKNVKTLRRSVSEALLEKGYAISTHWSNDWISIFNQDCEISYSVPIIPELAPSDYIALMEKMNGTRGKLEIAPFPDNVDGLVKRNRIFEHYSLNLNTKKPTDISEMCYSNQHSESELMPLIILCIVQLAIMCTIIVLNAFSMAIEFIKIRPLYHFFIIYPLVAAAVSLIVAGPIAAAEGTSFTNGFLFAMMGMTLTGIPLTSFAPVGAGGIFFAIMIGVLTVTQVTIFISLTAGPLVDPFIEYTRAPELLARGGLHHI